MKTIASITFGIASAVGACIAAASVASIVVADAPSQRLTSISGPDLWTATPVKIDRSAQTFERLPPVLSSYAVNAPASPLHPERALANATSTSTAISAPQTAFSSDHMTWCAGQYRSYDPATNSYRSFSGETRSCVSPFDGAEPVANAAVSEPSVAPSSVDAAMASWCSARYKSYRAEDNSYQPYDGPRRVCEGPRAGDQVASRL
ncbi:BA14K family protein [Rhizobium sp. S152]|uniref:BA14K family protein n=1 Tax=Rhizobium sp. S152 TaxID=3055038 RepID=UPI0025A9D21B|nr:BA14K family protein [Rhizobium sp. S152]MDM9628145.1 BA14K family protein [Rhizobium sp. S152]